MSTEEQRQRRQAMEDLERAEQILEGAEEATRHTVAAIESARNAIGARDLYGLSELYAVSYQLEEVRRGLLAYRVAGQVGER